MKISIRHLIERKLTGAKSGFKVLNYASTTYAPE